MRLKFKLSLRLSGNVVKMRAIIDMKITVNVGQYQPYQAEPRSPVVVTRDIDPSASILTNRYKGKVRNVCKLYRFYQDFIEPRSCKVKN